MLVELLNSDNHITFNVKTAQIFGLTTAVYLSELFSIYNKAIKKNKLVDDNYFKLDRKYMFIRTSISIEEQLRIDEKMMIVGIIGKHQTNPDIIKLDTKLYASILVNEDIELIEDLKSRFSDAGKKKTKKETKAEAIANNLKNSISCSDYELATALREWIDAIFSNPKGGFLSKTAVSEFQETLYNYTKGDLDLALRIVKIATIQGYRDCQWAINVYEKDERIKKSIEEKAPRVTTQKRATVDTLGKNVY